MSWDFFSPEEPIESEIDIYQEGADVDILTVVKEQHVVTDRELKVRLERKYFPWVIGRSLDNLVKSEKIKQVGYPGRKPKMGTPVNFYSDPELEYWEYQGLIKKKEKYQPELMRF